MGYGVHSPPADVSRATRILLVFETIAQHGPVTLQTLERLLPGVSRTAIWRNADALRAYGWVRMRADDKAFMVTTRPDDVLAKAKASPLALAELTDRVVPPPKDITAHFGIFTDMGRFEIIESTQKDSRQGEVLSLVEDDMAFAALVACENAEMLRHLGRWIKDPDTPVRMREIVTKGELTMPVRAARRQDMLWARGGGAVTFAHRAADGTVASVLLEPKTDKMPVQTFKDAVQNLMRSGS